MPEINSQLQSFLESRIGSRTALEVLLHMYRNPARDWSAEDIARDLRISMPDIRAALNQYKNNNLAIEREQNKFKYNVFNSQDTLVKELHSMMKTDADMITVALNRSLDQKVRSLSNAFRL